MNFDFVLTIILRLQKANNMDEQHKKIVEDLFSKYSMFLTEKGPSSPLYIMILQDYTVIPIVVTTDEGLPFDQYASAAINAAHETDAAALLLLCTQNFVTRKKGDPDVELLINGLVKASDMPDKEEYLTIMYMTSDGKTESLVSKIKKDITGKPYTVEFEWIGGVTNFMTPWKR